MYGITIRDTSLANAWERAMLFVSRSPMRFTFGGGSEVKVAKDSSVDFILNHNAVSDAINGRVHPDDPFCSPTKIEEYRKEYTAGFDASRFDYTYYDLLVNGFKRIQPAYGPKSKLLKALFNIGAYSTHNINQLTILKRGLQTQITEELSSNRNVAVLLNPAIVNYSNKAVPCLNEILVRWEGPGKCSVHTLFRSHDLATGWNPNMAAIPWLINERVAKPCGCTIDWWSEKNFSLHIYESDLHIAKSLTHILRNPVIQHHQDALNQIVE